MKTLLLASDSSLVLDGNYELAGKRPAELKWAHITTAAAGARDPSFLAVTRRRMAELGWNVDEIDIAGKDETTLRTLLTGKDTLWVQGGNSFYLLKHFRESGFDRVVKDLIDRGVPYVGTSAGAYIMTPSIETATWKHPDKNRHGITDFTGLGLVPFMLSAHYKPEYLPILKERAPAAKYPVRILADGQALLVQNGVVQFLGEGKEVTLSP